MYGPYNHGWMFDGMGMLFGGVWMILVLVVPALLIAALLKYLLGKPRHAAAADNPTPLDILKQAYARGEIKREEFLQKRADLLEK
jgi:putative membrane protein